VVGDDHGAAAVLGGKDGILRGEDPLRDYRDACVLVEPLEVAPGQPRVDECRRGRRRHDAQVPERRRVDLHPVIGVEGEARAEVPLARAEDRQVDGENDRCEPGSLGLAEHLLRHLAIRMPVELEPAAAFGSAADIRGACCRERREAHQRAGSRRGTRDRQLAVGVRHPLIRDRRGDDRHRQLGSEDCGRGGDVGDVDEDTRPQAPSVERLDVRPHRVLVARAAGEVPEGSLVESLFGEAFIVPDVQRVPYVRHAGENTAR